jgi:hypothetical protein
METLAPGGVDATAIGLGPLCTMVAQPVMALHALNMATMDICLNMTTPVLGSIVFYHDAVGACRVVYLILVCAIKNES